MDIKELEKQVEMLMDIAQEARYEAHKKDMEVTLQDDAPDLKQHEAILLNGMWAGRCYAYEEVLKLIHGEDII